MPPTSNIIVFQAQANTKNAQHQINALNNALAKMHSGAVQSARGTSQAMNTVSTSIGTAIGVGVVGAINTATQLFGDLVANVITNVAFFEKLTVSVTFYTARVLQAADATLGLNEAMAQASDEAQGTLLILEELALLSPFNVQQVSNAYRTAQAFGLSKDAVEGMLPLLIDFAAINNLAPDILIRISLALAQIQARGKLAAQEINQLANAGFPLRDILSEQLGITKAKIDELLKQGLIPSEEAFKGIIGFLKQFEGQAEIVTRSTLTGLISRLEDIRTIASKDIFLPLFQTAVPTIERLTDLLGGTQIKAALTIIGEALGEKLVKSILAVEKAVIGLANAWLGLSPIVKDTVIVFIAAGAGITLLVAAVGLLTLAVNTIVTSLTVFIAAGAAMVAAYSAVSNLFQNILGPAIDVVVQNVGAIGKAFLDSFKAIGEAISEAEGWLADFLSTVIDWGATLIEYFAAGVEGAAGLLEPVISGLTGFFTSWMAPSSPPRFLPDLETWGRDTANIYLQAWTQADFSILDDVTSQIGKGLEALADIGDISAVDVPSILIELRPILSEAIAELRNFGTISEQTFDQVTRAAGPMGDEIGLLLERYEELIPATTAVAEAQQQLTDITEKYAEILAPLQAEANKAKGAERDIADRRAILALQRTIANEAVGDNRRAEAQAKINTILAEQRLRHAKAGSEEEKSAAQKALDAAKKTEKAAEDALKLQQERLDVQIDSIRLYADQLEAIEKLRKEQERAAKQARKDLLQPLKDALKIYQLQQAELKDLISAEKQRYIIANEGFTEAEKAAAAIELGAIAARQAIRDFEAEELGFNLEDIRNTTIVFDDLGIKLGKAKAEAFDLGEILEGLNKGDPAQYFADFQETLEETRIKMKDLGTEFDGFLDRLNNSLPGFLQFRQDVDGSIPLLDNLKGAFAGLTTFLLGSKLIAVIGGIYAGLTFPAWIIPALAIGVGAYVGNWFGLRDGVNEATGGIMERFAELEASSGPESFFGRLRAAREEAQKESNRAQANTLFEETGFFPTTEVRGPTPTTQGILPGFLADEVQLFIDNIDTLPQRVKDATTTAIQAITATGTLWLEAGQEWARAFAEGMGIFFRETLPNFIRDFGTNSGQFIDDIGQTIRDFVQQFSPAEWLAGGFLEGQDFGEVVGAWLARLPGNILDGLAWVFDQASNLLPILANLALASLSALGSILGSVLRFIIGTVVPGIIGFIATSISAIIGFFVGLFTGAWKEGGEGGTGIKEGWLNAAESLQNLWTQVTEGVGDFLGAAWSAIWDPIVDGIIAGIEDAFGIDWEDIVANVEQFGKDLEAIWNNITNFLFNLFSGSGSEDALPDEQLVIQRMNVFGPLFDDMLPDWEAVKGLWESVVGFFTDTWQTIQDSFGAGVDWVLDKWDTFTVAFDTAAKFLDSVFTFLKAAFQVYVDYTKELIQIWVEIITGDVDALTERWNTFKDWWSETVESIKTVVSDLVNNTLAKLQEWKDWLVTELPEALREFRQGIIDWFVDAKDTVFGKAIELGESIMEGIKQGISNLVNAPQEALTAAKDTLLGWGEYIFGIGSPSRLFMERIGEPIGQGIAEGIADTDTDQAFKDLNSNLLTSFGGTQSEMAGATEDLTTTVRNQFEAFKTAISTLMGELVADMLKLWEGGMEELNTIMTTSLEAIADLWNTTWTTMQSTIATAMTGAINSVGLFTGPAAKAFETMATAVGTSFSGMIDNIDAELTRLIQTILPRLNGQQADSLLSQILLIMTGTTTGVQTSAGMGYLIGKSLIDGIIYGIEQNFHFLATVITNTIEEGIRLANTVQESGSPSQLWAREVGEPIAQGIAAGIYANRQLVGDAATGSIAEGLLYALNTRPSQVATTNTNINSATTYQLNVNSANNSQGVVQDFSILKSIVG